MIRLSTIILMLFLSACQNLGVRNENSPFYRVPGGSVLILNEDLTIPRNSLKIFIQDGRLAYAPNQFLPYCKLELWNPRKTPQWVKAEAFDVYRTAPVRDRFAMLDGPYLVTPVVLIPPFSGDMPSPIIYGTRMYLRSEAQPEVRRLMCGHLQDPNIEARDLTINQIRTTLGDIFTLRLPGELANLQ